MALVHEATGQMGDIMIRSLLLAFIACVASQACAADVVPEVAASREALSEVLSDEERARLATTDEESDAFARLRARQELANRIANQRMGDRATGEARPELSALYEERFRASRNAIVESVPRAEDWEEINDGLREARRRYEPSEGDLAADERIRRFTESDGTEVPR